MSTLPSITGELPDLMTGLAAARDRLLSNLVMIAELPAPTGKEAARALFMKDRFNEAGIQDYSSDEVDNVIAILPGTEETDEHILVMAHIDTVFPESEDHTISLQPDTIRGVGLGDNTLGAAVLISLPALLESLGIRFRHPLLLVGDSRSLGRGNLEGAHFFLNNNARPIKAGVCVEGVRIGRLNASSIGMLRGEITCSLPEEYDWSRFGASGAILMINEVINKITAIPLPSRPRTSIVFGSIDGGSGYSVIPAQAILRFEIRSEDADTMERVRQQMHSIADEVAARTGGQVGLDIFAQRLPGGIEWGHPLVHNAREIMQALGLKPRQGPSTSELAALIDHQIPAVTIGLTSCDKLNETGETLAMDPLFTGLAQFIGILQAIDGGCCDEA